MFGARPERRHASPEHRERVHAMAQQYTTLYAGDVSKAASAAESDERWRRTLSLNNDGPSFLSDVAALLRRRADTLKGVGA